MPRPVPVIVDDWAHASSLAAIATMAAKKSCFMCSSPRAGESNSQPSADGNTKKKKLFLLAHETQCVGELSN
jgi:hypothetical protein